MRPTWSDGIGSIYQGDALTVLRELPSATADCCITSPPYWGLRDYGLGDQGIGLEPTPEEWCAKLVAVFREVRRVLRDDATLWVNCGDAYASQGGHAGQGGSSQRQGRANISEQNRGSYSTVTPGLKPKDLIGLPWMLAFALRADGWYLRSDIIWSKPNPMPESVQDRPTSAHEHLFLLSKRERYYYDAEAIREPAEARDAGEIDGGPQRLPDGSRANEGRNYRRPNAPGAIESPFGQGFTRRAKRPAGWNDGPTELDRIGHYKQDGHGPRHEGFNGRYFDENWQPRQEALSRNKRNVWTIATQPYPEAHFATFPEALVEPCILAGCPVEGTVLDPFAGSGTTLAVAKRLNRDSIGIELNPEYLPLIERRCGREMAQTTMSWGAAQLGATQEEEGHG
ncbi:MAG: DNA-methyltransferase [Acidimicrobiales bacterium]